MTTSDKLREFADKWGFSQDKTDEGFLIDNDRTRQCLSDLTALIEEHYVKKEEHEKLVNAALQNKPQPTAEGAEEIDDETIAYAAEYQCGTPFSERWIGFVKGAKWHRSLHAQKIADKMVSEMLREELIKYDRWMSGNYWGVKQIPTPEQSVDEYLKSRER